MLGGNTRERFDPVKKCWWITCGEGHCRLRAMEPTPVYETATESEPPCELNLTREQLREVLSAVRERRDAILHYGDGHLDRELVQTLSEILDLLETLLEKLD